MSDTNTHKGRKELKELFSTGKVPTEEDFASIFDSSLNLQDDGIERFGTTDQDIKFKGNVTVEGSSTLQKGLTVGDQDQVNLTVDNEGSLLINKSLNLSGTRIQNIAKGESLQDAVNLNQLNTKKWTSSEITDFDAQVRTSSLNQMSSPTAPLDMNSQGVTNLAQPLNLTDAANKQYVDSQVNTRLTQSTADDRYYPKSYKLNNIDAPTGNVSMNSKKITSLANPTYSSDAATKGYVDSVAPSHLADYILSYNNMGRRLLFTAAPRFSGASSNYSGTRGWINSSGGTGRSNTDGESYSLTADGHIRAAEFNAWSSIKRKNVLDRSEAVIEEATELLKQLSFVKYDFKDKGAEGETVCYGLIAEEACKVVPDYVDCNTSDFVPNILQSVKIERLSEKNKVRLIFKYDIPALDSNILGVKVKNYLERVTILEVRSRDLIVEDGEGVFDSLEDDDIVVAYGTYELCPTMAKPKLFEMHMAVTQGLLKRIEELEARLTIAKK